MIRKSTKATEASESVHDTTQIVHIEEGEDEEALIEGNEQGKDEVAEESPKKEEKSIEIA